MWDEDYPDKTCAHSTNSHCGATFIPTAEDQEPYLPVGHPTCKKTAGAEGITSAPKSNIPWSIKWVRGFCSFLDKEGFWGGHVQPFFHREKFAWSFWDFKPDSQRSNAVLRCKWSGKLLPNRFVKP